VVQGGQWGMSLNARKRVRVMQGHTLYLLNVGRLGRGVVREEGMAFVGAAVPRFAAVFRVPGSVEDLHLTSLSPE
jgi:hypothetical protein